MDTNPLPAWGSIARLAQIQTSSQNQNHVYAPFAPNPSASEAKPNLSGAKPSLSAAKPSLSGAKPIISVAKPSLSGAKPGLSEATPSLSAAKPSRFRGRAKSLGKSVPWWSPYPLSDNRTR